MLGPSHLLFAANAWAGYALYTHQPIGQLALGAVVATAVSDGVLSPDMDQRKPFEWARDVLGPAGRLLAHRRGVTHWWALPVTAWVWWLPLLDPSTVWAATALLIGWASHIVGDVLIGTQGVPVLIPGWGPTFCLRLVRTGQIVEEGEIPNTRRWGPLAGRQLPVSPLRTVLTLALTSLVWVNVMST